MNYIYGKLQKQVEKVEYTAIDTDTAVVTINNVDRTIQVDINLGSDDPLAKQSYVKEAVGVEAKERQNADDMLQKDITEEIKARQDADDALRNSKQDALVPGENIKTINEQSLLGEGDLDVRDVVVSDTQPTNNAVLWVTPDESAQRSVLSSLSWQEIAVLSNAGKATCYLRVGDEKTITLTTGEEVTFVILGFNHDDLADGSGKAGITFGMKNLLATKYSMNSSNTNEGGWESSAMRTSTMATLLSQLPSDLQSVIKQVSKKATAGSKSTTITTSTDKLFLFSEVELDATTTTGYASEGEQYEYWKTRNTDNDRIKKLSNGTGSANVWWLRSPNTSGTTGFRCIVSTGSVGNVSAGGSIGVCFGFCV